MGDEAAAVEVRREDLVRLDEKEARGVVHPAERKGHALQLRHIEGSRGALSGNVGDEDGEASVAQGDEIVVVPPDFVRRKTECRDGEPRDADPVLGEEAHLNGPGDAELFFQALLLRRLG